MYLMQVDAFGSDDRRCAATNDKIIMVQETGTILSPHNKDHRAPEMVASKDSETDDGNEEERGERGPMNRVMKMLKLSSSSKKK